MAETTYNYKGEILKVRGGAWLDIMNSCFYTEIERIPRLKKPDVHVCVDHDGKRFVLLWG